MRDPETFKQELARLGVEPMPIKDPDEGGIYYREEGDGLFWIGGYESNLDVFDPDTQKTVDLATVIQEHIVEDSYAEIMQVTAVDLLTVHAWVLTISADKLTYHMIDELSEVPEDY